MKHKEKTNPRFFLFGALFGAVMGIIVLVRDVNMTEEEIYLDAHKPRTGKGTGLAYQQIQETFGKTGVIIFHCILTFGVGVGSFLTFYYERSKERQNPQNERTSEMVIDEIMEFFEQKHSLKVSEIAEYLDEDEIVVIGYLCALVGMGKIVEVGDDEYCLREDNSKLEKKEYFCLTE